MTNSRNSIEIVRVLINTALLIFFTSKTSLLDGVPRKAQVLDIVKDLFLRTTQTSYLLIESE